MRHTRSHARSAGHASQAIRRQARRDVLVHAATDAIRRRGREVSMEAMAAEAGITKPILYRYFGDRDGLITAVAECFADGLVVRLDQVLSEPGEPQELVRRAIDCYVAFIEEDPALYGFFSQHAAVGGTAVKTVVDRVAATVARSLDDGLRQAGTDSGPAETWAYGIVGMVHMAGAHWVDRPTIPRHRLIDYLTALVDTGVEGAAANAAIPSTAASN